MPQWLKKALLVLVLGLIYFTGVRSVRGLVHNALMGTLLPAEYGSINEQLEFLSQSSVSFTISETEVGGVSAQFKIPFGSFFLFACIGLIIISAHKEHYLVLAGIHVAFGVLSVVFVWLGIHVYSGLLIIPDALARYLVPLASLGLVPLVYVQTKKQISDER